MKKHPLKSFIGYGSIGICKLQYQLSIKNTPYTTRIYRLEKTFSQFKMENRVYFRKKKYNQLLLENKNPLNYDYIPEWELFWKYSLEGLKHRDCNVRCRRVATLSAYTNSLN